MKVLYDSERLGGLFLMLGAASLLFIIGEYVTITIGAPGPGDVLARVAYYDANYPDLARGWHFEIVAMACLGAGALMRLNTPGKGGWALAAMGVAAVFPMYPMMIGGYPAAFDAAQDSTVAYDVVNTIVVEVFHAGNMLACFGLALGLWLERGAPGQRAPGWVLILGAVSNGIAGLGFLALHAGAKLEMAMIGPFGLIAFLALAIFGAFQAFKRVPAAE